MPFTQTNILHVYMRIKFREENWIFQVKTVAKLSIGPEGCGKEDGKL